MKHRSIEHSLPPHHLETCIGMICNGEMENSTNLQNRLRQCATIIGVDGGLNHCRDLNITPHWMVGDFDSVKSEVLEQFRQNINSSHSQRAKNCTDLEAAIEKAKTMSHAQIVIFAGLGGRIDHTLANIFLLLRNPARLFLESEDQVLFAVNDKTGRVEIKGNQYQTCALFPLNGTAQNVWVEDEKKRVNYPTIDRKTFCTFSFQEKCFLNIEKGELLVILDKREILPFQPPVESIVHTQFSIHQPIIHILQFLAHQSQHPEVELVSDQERVIHIQPSSGKCHFVCEVGQTISLIPLYGPAKGIRTEGLKWELGKGVNQLDKNFVGISNVCMKNGFSVQLDSGELLCIINNLIDKDMVEATMIIMD